MVQKNDEIPQMPVDISSRMDEIDSVIDALVSQQHVLDKADLSRASIHLNEAIECLRLERLRLAKGL
jgi:hypothetical protein